MTTSFRAARITACAAVLGLSIASCAGPPGLAAAPVAATPTAGSDQLATFCEAFVDVEAATGTGPAVDFATATPEEIQAALQEFGAMVEPFIAAVEESAPDAVAEDIAVVARPFRDLAATGDGSLFESPEFAAAEDDADAYVLAECGYEQLEITAVDHGYEGLPDTLTTGIRAITLVNEGAENHEIGFARVNDGVTLTVEEILALPMEEAMASVTIKGLAFADPGGSDTAFIRFDEPGTYGAVCFVTEGSVGGTEGSGPPHFTLGQVGEISVT